MIWGYSDLGNLHTLVDWLIQYRELFPVYPNNDCDNPNNDNNQPLDYHILVELYYTLLYYIKLVF
jgi:hypothetical protein